MTPGSDLPSRIADLSDDECDVLLRELLEALMQEAPELVADSEEAAREVVASFVSRTGQPVGSDEVLPPTTEVATHVRATLRLLAEDPDTARLVEDTLARLPESTQMFVDPITAAVVLGVLVAFLQTKFSVKVSQKDGRTEFEASIAKDATSDQTVEKVIDAVRAVALP
jgi:hypothetical protein